MRTKETEQTASPQRSAHGASDAAIATYSDKPLQAAVKAADASSTSAGAVTSVPPKTVCTRCQVDVVASHSGSMFYAPSLISAVLVISGWFVINKAQANRERRKQIREFLTELIKNLAELEESVINYHTKPREASVEQALIDRLARFERACGLPPQFVASQRFLKAVPPKNLKVDPSVIQRMRKAMTLKHFSDEHTEQVDRGDPLIREIVDATDEVREKLEEVRLVSLD